MDFDDTLPRESQPDNDDSPELGPKITYEYRVLGNIQSRRSAVTLKRVGFFRELSHGDSDGESIHSVARMGRYDELQKKRIRHYLENGELMVACPGLAYDVLSDSGAIAGPPDELSDGVWTWPGDLLYYFNEYSLALPEKFIRHIFS